MGHGDKSFVIGAAAGPWPYINSNCEVKYLNIFKKVYFFISFLIKKKIEFVRENNFFSHPVHIYHVSRFMANEIHGHKLNNNVDKNNSFFHRVIIYDIIKFMPMYFNSHKPTNNVDMNSM